MGVVIDFFIIISYVSSLDLGSLGGFLTLDEIEGKIQALAKNYPKILSYNGTYFDKLILSSGANQNYFKPEILITGGLSANPMSAFQVLYTVESMASQYQSGNSTIVRIVDGYNIVFVPVMNYKAYQYMQTIFNTTYVMVQTGLEPIKGCAPGNLVVDIGINPDRNFPYNWDMTNDNCSNQNSGEFPLESNITLNTTYLFNYTLSPNGYAPSPALLIYFQDQDYHVCTPYSSVSNTLDPYSSYFYGLITPYIPKNYTYGSMEKLTGTALTGTLIDYAYSLKSLALQIGTWNISAITSKNIYSIADTHNNLVINIIQQLQGNVIILLPQVSEDLCPVNTTCGYYSLVNFIFTINNSGGLDYYFDVDFTPGLSSGYLINVVTISISETYTGPVSQIDANYTSLDNISVAFSSYVPGYSFGKIVFIYHRHDAGSSQNYNADAKFSTTYGYFYNSPVHLTKSGNIQGNQLDSTNNNSRDKAMATGLVLLVILLILLLIVGIVLFCKRKKYHEQNNFSPDPNFRTNKIEN
jgi:Zinc carboxypeptidase